MAQENQLALLKADLGLYGTLPEPAAHYLDVTLTAAEELIAREGVRLDREKAEDDALCASYAAWLYRKRASSENGPMPRMLRYALNLRIVGGAAEDTP